jgi:hypothetical protein
MSLDRVFLVSQSGDKGALQPVFPTHRTSQSGAHSDFLNSFSGHLDEYNLVTPVRQEGEKEEARPALVLR